MNTTKTNWKRRLVSALLALTMLSSYLPQTLFLRTQAVLFDATNEDGSSKNVLTIDDDGSFSVVYEGTAAANSGLGSSYFLLVPDISVVNSTTNTVSGLQAGGSQTSGAVLSFLKNTIGLTFAETDINKVARLIPTTDTTTLNGQLDATKKKVSFSGSDVFVGELQTLPSLNDIYAALKECYGNEGFYVRGNPTLITDPATQLGDAGIPYVAILFSKQGDDAHWNQITGVYRAAVENHPKLEQIEYVYHANVVWESGVSHVANDDTFSHAAGSEKDAGTYVGSLTNNGDGAAIFKKVEIWTAAMGATNTAEAYKTSAELCPEKNDSSSGIAANTRIEPGETYYLKVQNIGTGTAAKWNLTSGMPVTGYAKVTYVDASDEKATERILVIPVRILGNATNGATLSLSAGYIRGTFGAMSSATIIDPDIYAVTAATGPWQTKVDATKIDQVKYKGELGKEETVNENKWIRIFDEVDEDTEELQDDEYGIHEKRGDKEMTAILENGKKIAIRLTEDGLNLPVGLHVETLNYEYYRGQANDTGNKTKTYARFTVFIEVLPAESIEPTVEGYPTYYSDPNKVGGRTDPTYTYDMGDWGSIDQVVVDGHTLAKTGVVSGEDSWSYSDGTLTLNSKALDTLGLPSGGDVNVRVTFGTPPAGKGSITRQVKLKIEGQFQVKVTVTADVENYSHEKITLRDSAGNTVDVNTGSGPWSVGSTKNAAGAYTKDYTYSGSGTKVGTEYTVWVGDVETTVKVTVGNPNVTLNFRSVTASTGTGAGKVGIGTTAALAQTSATDGSDKTLTRLVENKDGSAVYLYAQPDSSHGGTATWEYTGTSGGTSGDAVSISALVATTTTPTEAQAKYGAQYTVTAKAGNGAASASATPPTVLDGGQSTLSATAATGYDFTTLTWTLTKADGTAATTAAPSGGKITPKEDVIATASYSLYTPSLTTTKNVTTNGGSDGELQIGDMTHYPASATNLTFTLLDDSGNPVSGATIDRATGVVTGVPAGTYQVKLTDTNTNLTATSGKTPVSEPGAATVTVNLDGKGKDGLTLVATQTDDTSKKITVTASSSGVYTFDTLVTGKSYTVSLGGSTGALGADWKQSTTKATISSGNNATLTFYTITTKTSTSASSVYLDSTSSKTSGVYQSGTTFTATAVAADGYGGNATWSTAQPTSGDKAGTVCTGPAASASGTASAAVTVTGTTEISATFSANQVYVKVYLNGALDTAGAAPLTAAADILLKVAGKPDVGCTTLTGGVATFTNVPEGSYTIWINDVSTGISLTATNGENGTTALNKAKILYYCDVNLITDDDTKGTATATYDGTTTPATTTSQKIATILANAGGDSFNSHTVTTVATDNTNIQHDWSSNGVGTWTNPTAKNSSWKLPEDYTGGAVTLKPVYDRSGYALKVIVKKDNVLQGSDATTAPSVTVKLSASGFTTLTAITDANGSVTFNGLQNKDYTITVNDGTDDWRDKGSATIASDDKEVTLEYFTVTAAKGTGAQTATVNAPDTTNKVVMKGKNATLGATPEAGYNGPVSWDLTKTNGDDSSSVSGSTLTVKDTVTATANYTKNIVTLTTKLNGSATGGYALTLYNGTATTFTGTTSTTTGSTLGTVTFNAVPAGTYDIYDANDDTGVDVVVTSGSANNGGSAEIRYYEVKYVDVKSNPDHGTYDGVTSPAVPASGYIIINSDIADRRKVTLPDTSPDTNYKLDSWKLTPASGVGSAPAATAEDWTATKSTSYTTAGAITLQPVFGKEKASLKVIVKRNDNLVTAAAKEVQVTGPSSYDKKQNTDTTTSSTTFTSLTNGEYTAVVTGWENDGTASAKKKTIPATFVDQELELLFYDYTFDGNKPAAATGTVSGVPAGTIAATDPTNANGKPVLTGYSLPYPAKPTLSGYQFKGWNTDQTNATAGTATWTQNSQSITSERTYYAVWAENKITVTVYKDGTAETTKVVKLKKGTDEWTGTASGKVTTFGAMPSGTYTILVGDKDTNHTVTVVEGTTVNHDLYYYTVNYASLANASLHGKYGTAADKKDTAAAGEVLAGGMTSGTDNANFVTLPDTVADTNYLRTKWDQAQDTNKTPGTFDPSTNNAKDATKWTVKGDLKSGGAITLTPIFTKDKASITVTVNLNGSPSKDQTVTRNTTDQTPKTDTSGQMTITGLDNGTHTLGVKDWDGTKDATISDKADITDFVLDYYEYAFVSNEPDEAANTATDMPDDSTVPVISGTKINYKAPTLKGYTFKGWATSDDAADGSWKGGQDTIDGNNNDATSGKRIYYAIWGADSMSLENMNGKAAMGLTVIKDFTTSTGSGGGGTAATDYTYTVEDTATKDGITVTATASGFTVTVAATGATTKTTGLKSDKSYDVTFNVKAVSKINGTSDTATITINVEPTYRVVYDLNLPTTGTTNPATAPTDNGYYIKTTNGFGAGNTITADTTDYKWIGDTFTFAGWSLTAGGETNTTFDVGTAVTSQSVDPGGNITLYAKWTGKDYSVENTTLNAIYHQGKTNADGSASPAWVVSGQNLDSRVNNGGGKEFMTYTVESTTKSDGTKVNDSTTKLPDWLGIHEDEDGNHLLRVKDGYRVGDADTYTIKINAASSSNNKEATMTVTVKVDKAMPVIDTLAITSGTWYHGDPALDPMTYVNVHDPYVTDAEAGTSGGRYENQKILTTGTSSATETKGSWTANPATLDASKTKYNYKYTPADTANYKEPDEDATITVVTRSISLQVRDDDKTAQDWSNDFKNSNSFTYIGTDNWTTTPIQVRIRIPKSNNSDIEKLTWTATYDGAFKDVKFVKVASSTTTVPSTATEITQPNTLNRIDDDEGEWILTFNVNQGKDTDSHTLKVVFTGEAGVTGSSLTSTGATAAGDKKGSYKTTTATYTYTMGTEASTLDKPHPDLTRVEVNDTISAPDGSQECGTNDCHDYSTLKFEKNKPNGQEVVDEKQGGLHVVFAPISQDKVEEGTTNPVEKYVVKLYDTVNADASTGGTLVRTVDISAGNKNSDGYYHYYWEAATTTGSNSGPVPGHNFRVEVQAITANDKAYESSASGKDKVEKDGDGSGGGGYKQLTIDMLEVNTKFTDKVFTGLDQNGGGAFRLKNTYTAGIGTISINYDDGDGNSKTASKKNVNLTRNTDPAPSVDASSAHDYDIYVSVARGTLYLALDSTKFEDMTDPVVDGKQTNVVAANAANVVTTADNKKVNNSRTPNPHANWEIVQAKATMSLTNSFTGLTETEKDIRPNPSVSYTTANNAQYNVSNSNKTITHKYDITYTVVSSPSASYVAGATVTEDQLEHFKADVEGDYTFRATASYKTGDDEDIQFQADVSECFADFTFSTNARSVTGIKLERYEAVNGTTGVTGVDTNIAGGNQNLSQDRPVTYGTPVLAIDEDEDAGIPARVGFYAATDRTEAKQMSLVGLRITISYDGGDPDVYVIGDGKTLPSAATWTSSTTTVADSPAITDSFLTFKGAGVNKSFKTNLTFSYGGKTSNAVTYTMEKRPLDFTVTHADDKVWNNSAVVTGTYESQIPDNLAGDNVKVAVFKNAAGNDEFQTTSSKYTAGKTYGPDEGYRNSGNNRIPSTADANVAKDKEVRAVTVGASGSGIDVVKANTTDPDDSVFYKRGKETPGKASIKPSLVTKLDVKQPEPSAATTPANNNSVNNSKYKSTISTKEDEKKIGSNWSLTPSTTWEAWDPKANGGAGGWGPVTDIFKIDTVYRATVVVEADTNHYMLDPENPELAAELKAMMGSYTINGKKVGEYCIEDLDEWNSKEENKVTVSVEESKPFHPDWLPDTEVLYHNVTKFTYVFHTFETPTLQFSDEKGSWNEETPDPKVGTHHEPGQYVHHNEVVTEGDPGMTYLIAVNASVKDIFGAQVLLTNKELLDAGATLKIVQGNGTIDTALPVDEDREHPMYKLSSAEFENEHDLIIYELTIPSSVTATKGLYHLEFQATGATTLENLNAGKIDVAKSYYTFTLNVLEKQVPPVISGGGGVTVLDAPVVTYMLRNLGYTSDQTAEKITRKGAKPSFVPEITPVSGLKFLGWSEVDPATVKDGKLPELVDPLTFSISDDKVFYAVYEQIKYDHSHYVIGFPNGSFGPDANITRAEVATVIARSCLEGFVEGSDYGNPGNYSDASTHWAFSAISYCSLKGVFAGYEDGTFRPDRYISRQELATVVARLAGVQANQGLNFVDSGDVANWALNGVYTNVANGWVNGYEDNTFRPLNDITRAETVKIFNGYLNRGVDKEGLKNLHEYVHTGVASNNTENGHDEYMVWPDVAKTHWAYYEIIEAANDHNYTWRDDEKGEKRTAPPEDWNEAFIDERWRYDDNANDGADNRGDKITEVTVTYMVKSDGVIWDSTTEIVKIYESPSVENLPTVRPNEGFRFAGWSETDPDTGVITLVDPTENYVTEDKIFYAVFELDVPFEMPKVTVTYVIGDKGTTNAHSLTEVVEMYQSPTVENLPRVTAKAGYYFAGWSSTDPATGVVTIVDPTENYVIEDKTFYAVFKVEQTQEMPTVTVTYVIGEQGSAEGAELVQTVDLYESPSVEALPHVTANEGYRFAGWSSIDPATGEHNEVDPTASYVTQDITFYAVYEVAITGVNELPENFGAPDNLGEPVTPEDPEQPEEPVNPEQPEEPVNPEQPEEPENPEQPEEPENPEQPEEPVDPNQPVEPPEQPEEPENPELPEEPENPEEPEVPIGPVVYARTKYISGFEDETFRPDAVITRAAVASIIANMNGYDAEVTYDAEGLSDLEGHWAKNVIAFCVELGLMSGYEDGTFQPDRSMSRQELAVVLARMSGGVLSSEGLYFSDAADVADWAADGVYTAYANGWMNGYEDGSFQPERRVTRAEAVKMFNAYLGRSADPERIERLGGYTVLPDVPETHWAYYEIIEASNNWLE